MSRKIIAGAATAGRVSHSLRESYPGELARVLGRAPATLTRALADFEIGGVLVSVKRGVERRHRINPRLPIAKELLSILETLVRSHLPLQKGLRAVRMRPRRMGKPL